MSLVLLSSVFKKMNKSYGLFKTVPMKTSYRCPTYSWMRPACSSNSIGLFSSFSGIVRPIFPAIRGYSTAAKPLFSVKTSGTSPLKPSSFAQ